MATQRYEALLRVSQTLISIRSPAVAWLGGIAFMAPFFFILVFYVIPFLYFRH